MDTGSADAAAALRRVGLRVTAPRLVVLTALAAGAPHTSVDALVSAVRERLGDGSAQTVYNVLRTFTDVGLVRRIEPAGRPGLYELRVGDNHHHLICRRCGAIADVDCAVGETPCLTAAADAGYEIDEAEVIYWGRCPACVAATQVLGRPELEALALRLTQVTGGVDDQRHAAQPVVLAEPFDHLRAVAVGQRQVEQQ